VSHVCSTTRNTGNTLHRSKCERQVNCAKRTHKTRATRMLAPHASFAAQPPCRSPKQHTRCFQGASPSPQPPHFSTLSIPHTPSAQGLGDEGGIDFVYCAHVDGSLSCWTRRPGELAFRPGPATKLVAPQLKGSRGPQVGPIVACVVAMHACVCVCVCVCVCAISCMVLACGYARVCAVLQTTVNGRVHA
jgi:hypothetical protein